MVDLDNYHFTVSAFHYPPKVYYQWKRSIEITVLKISQEVSNEKEEWDGVEVRLLRTVGEAMNFKYE